jgi:putative transposase
MPAKNAVKVYVNNCFYHAYNRGVNKRAIFLDGRDYIVFLNLLKRYLAPSHEVSRSNTTYPNFSKDVELLAFCLMPNHFHLLLYQLHDKGITELMRSLTTSYSMYFNHRYNRVGPLFQGKFKARMINRDDYLHHISRYIHLNPKEYATWPYSSLPYYRGEYSAPWIKPQRILELFDNQSAYMDFVKDYEEQKAILDELKYELADL